METKYTHRKGEKTHLVWGSLTTSQQTVAHSLWFGYARQLMAQYSSGNKESPTKLNILNALTKVMERLSCTVSIVCGQTVNETVPGILEFEEAFRIYCKHISTEACDLKKLQTSFQQQICNPELGLPVVILSHNEVGKWVVLQSTNISIQFILTTLLDELEQKHSNELTVSEFGYSHLKSLMSTDFDRKLLDLVFAEGKSKSQLLGHGINISTTVESVKEKIDALGKLDDEAGERANAKLECEINYVEKQVKANNLKEKMKKEVWPEPALIDLKNEGKRMNERLTKLKEIKLAKTEHAKLLMRRRVVYAKGTIIKEKELKKVGRSNSKQGAKRKLTDSDDEYVASMFSEHAGYHGLRNTVTEYIGTVDRTKRIKLEDVKKYYNMRRAQREESTVSTSTARRRLAPRRKTSQAAKNHVGRCLISVAVPPRTGDSSNENTHFARKFRSGGVEEWSLLSS